MMYVYRSQRQDSGELWILDKEGKRLAAILLSGNKTWDQMSASDIVSELNDPKESSKSAPAYAIRHGDTNYRRGLDGLEMDTSAPTTITGLRGAPICTVTSLNDAEEILAILTCTYVSLTPPQREEASCLTCTPETTRPAVPLKSSTLKGTG
jgi:hypothetical protein